MARRTRWAASFALRARDVAYLSLVIENGSTVKKAQTLARHATPDLTMNVYGRTREGRLQETVERVAQAMQPAKRATYVQKLAVGAETESATPVGTGGCASEEWWRRRESNPSPKVCCIRNLHA